MKLSVSIVTYNEAEYVEQAIESALGQETTFPFEVVVGDDASTDGTRQILERLQKERPGELRCLFSERNFGDHGLTNFLRTLDACTGEYVALLDGDDYWTSPDKLRRQVEFLDEHPECALCGHRVEETYDDGRIEISRGPRSRSDVCDVADLLLDNFLPKLASVHRRRHAADVPDWYRTCTVASADWVFNVLSARHGAIGFLDDVMAVHRKRRGSLSAEYGMPRMLEDRELAFELLRPYFPGRASVFVRAVRRNRWKLRAARLGPGFYGLARRIYGRCVR